MGVKFVTSLTDPGQPYSCDSWQSSFGNSEAPLVIDENQSSTGLFSLLHDSWNAFPTFAIIDHTMTVRVKPWTLDSNSNSNSCDGSNTTIDGFSGGDTDDFLMQLIEECGFFDHILVPIGGGGLIAGTALAVKYFGDKCSVIGTEPLEVDDAYRSLISGKVESNKTTNTIADGLKTQLGDKNFPIILEEVKSIIRITEDEIIDSMKLIWQHLKIICEPSCSLPLAGIIKNKEQFLGKKIGIIITGGNVDLKNLPF